MKLKIELEIMFKNNTSPRGNNVWGMENFKGCDHGKFSYVHKFSTFPYGARRKTLLDLVLSQAT